MHYDAAMIGGFIAAQTRRLIKVARSNTGAMMASRVLNLMSGFALSVVLVRGFGLEAMGTYTVALPLIAVFGIVCSAGLQYALPRETLSNGQRTTVAVVGWLATLPITIAATVLYADLMATKSSDSWAIILFACGGPPLALTNVLITILLLERKAWWSLVPSAVTAFSVLYGGIFAADIVELALVLLIARLIGSFALIVTLPVARLPVAALRGAVVAGLRFLHLDGLAAVSSQCSTAILAVLLTRDELGLYGICRQLQNAADTPYWSYLQAKYPKMVRTQLADKRRLEQISLVLSVVSGVSTALMAVVLAYWVYKKPIVASLMAVMMLNLPPRYVTTLYSFAARALGRIDLATKLQLAAMMASFGIVSTGAIFFQLWGVVWTSLVVELIMLAYATVLVRSAFPIPVAEES